MNNIFTILGATFGLLVSIKALVSKSDLEQIFLTHEKILKMKFYRLIGLSAAIAILLPDIYFIWCLIYQGKTFQTVNWNFIIGLVFLIFLFSLMCLSILKSIIIGIFARYHYMYKVNIDDIGDVYILKMLNQSVCICSKDPNSNIKQDDSESYLIGLDLLMKKPLIKIKIQRPQNSIQKLIKYNSPSNEAREYSAVRD